jgi:hypothetical protein
VLPLQDDIFTSSKPKERMVCVFWRALSGDIGFGRLNFIIQRLAVIKAPRFERIELSRSFNGFSFLFTIAIPPKVGAGRAVYVCWNK